jgi:hypothetical protein
MPEPKAALLALLVDIRNRRVLHDLDRGVPYLDLPDGDRADVSRAVAVAVRAGWCWLPDDTLLYRLTDLGRGFLDGAP